MRADYSSATKARAVAVYLLGIGCTVRDVARAAPARFRAAPKSAFTFRCGRLSADPPGNPKVFT
jgi:hypothetical protein